MFKNIFPDKLNKLVFMAGGPEAAKAAESIKSETDPAALRAEAAELGQAIDGYAKAIERDINQLRSTTTEDYMKIDLSNPKSYEHLDQALWSVVQSLAEAKMELKKGGATRVNLDLVRVKVEAAAIFNRSIRLAGDPLAHSADVEVSRIAKAGPKPEKIVVSRESVEASNWAKMALLVDEYNKLGETKDDKARQAAIQTELMPLASKVMQGKNKREVNGLQIFRAPGAGTEAFKFVMIDRARRLEQGGRPGATTVGYEEVTVYAGGSAKDFPTKS